MKKLLFGLLLSLTSATASASTFEEVLAATHKLWSGNNPVCSGAFVKNSAYKPSPGFGKEKYKVVYVTAAHCVDNGNLNIRKQVMDDKLKVLSEEIYYFEVLRSFKDEDVAILVPKNENVEFPVLDVASNNDFKNMFVGKPTMTVGFPRGGSIIITEGHFTGVDTAPGLGDNIFIRSTPLIYYGSSGGGLFAKFGDSYKLIGTVTGAYVDSPWLGYYTHTNSINKVLSGVLAEPLPDNK